MAREAVSMSGRPRVAAVCFTGLAGILAWRRPDPAPATSAAANVVDPLRRGLPILGYPPGVPYGPVDRRRPRRGPSATRRWPGPERWSRPRTGHVQAHDFQGRIPPPPSHFRERALVGGDNVPCFGQKQQVPECVNAGSRSHTAALDIA
jgi:hypothetical protein